MNVMTAFTAESAYGSYGRHGRIRVRRGIIGCGTGFTVALDEAGKVRYAGENRWGQKDATLWRDMLSVYCGPDYVLGICRDGGVLSAGRSTAHGINVKSWACVSAIACGPRHAAALISNGQVLTSGDDRYGQCGTGAWRDMVDVCCGRTYTAGLKNDGTLLLAGGGKRLRHVLERWPKVAGIFSDEEGKQLLAITYGDGRLLSSSALPACTGKWRNLVFVAASARGVVGVTAQGKLLSSRREDGKKLERLEKDYTVCAMGPGHLSVVCRNGEVVSLGHNEFGQCATARWGCLFRGFEDFSNHRRDVERIKEETEKLYQKRLTEATRHSRRLVCGERLTACIKADGHVFATAGLRNVKDWRDVCQMSSGSAHLLALHKDGTVSAEGNNVGGCCRVKHWTRIKAIRTGKYHSLGLCEDGTVMFSGWNLHGQGNVSEWKGIRILRSTDTYTVGVDVEGKILTSGQKLPFDPQKLDMNEWKELIDLALSEHHMVGLRKNGTVVAVGDQTVPNRDDNGRLTDYAKWYGVRAIAAGDGFTAGLCYGGHVLTAGRNDFGQCETETWNNVVFIGCGRSFTAALTADGRVLTAGHHMSGHSQGLSSEEIGEAVMAWEKSESTGYEPFHTEWMKDILAMKCGREHLVTVDVYGQVMADGLDLDGQCTSASTFVLFKEPKQLDGSGTFTTSGDLMAFREEKSSQNGNAKKGDASDKSHKNATWSEKKENSVTGNLYTTHSGLEKLRRLNDEYLKRLSCGDDHIAVIRGDGAVSVCDLTDRRLCHVSADTEIPPMRSMSSQHRRTAMVARDGTPWVYSHAKGRLEPLTQLPENRRQNIKEVVQGREHTVVLYTDGKVYAVGENEDGRCDTRDWRNIVSVAVGEHHTVGVTADGRVLATGSCPWEDRMNHFASSKYDPCYTDGWIDVARVICGSDITYGIKVSGEVVAVGKNTYGQCRTEGWHDVEALSTSGNHTVGLLHNGRVVAVGKNDHGECDVDHWENMIAVGALHGLTVGLTSDGRVLSAGRRTGQLPMQGAVYAMKVSGNRQVFVLSDGTVSVCSADQDRAVSLPEEMVLFDLSPAIGAIRRMEAALPWDMTARALTGCVGQGIIHSVYLTDRSLLKTTDPLNRLPSDADMQAHTWVSSGPYHAMAVTQEGNLRALGKAPEDRAPEALEALAAKDTPPHERVCWRSVTCGTQHTVAVTSQGRVYAVGKNDVGQCDTEDFANVSMVACGLKHTVAMTEDGRALATGDNTYGQCNVRDWTDLAMVACGEGHTVGLFLDGHVEAVGDNRLGQCRLEKAWNVSFVACLPEATVCVGADGRVTVYGGTGEFRDRLATLTDVIAVYACEYRLTALMGDGRLIAVN